MQRILDSSAPADHSSLADLGLSSSQSLDHIADLTRLHSPTVPLPTQNDLPVNHARDHVADLTRPHSPIALLPTQVDQARYPRRERRPPLNRDPKKQKVKEDPKKQKVVEEERGDNRDPKKQKVEEQKGDKADLFVFGTYVWT